MPIKNKILVVGSVNTDMVVKSNRIPSVGETVTGGRFVLAAGGKGANQAVAAARLGGQVTFVAQVGTDSFGDQAIAGYQREGIDTRFIFRDPDEATGVALILVDDQGRNLISVAPGANFSLTPEQIDQAQAAFADAAVLLLQLEVPMPVVCRAAERAAAAGVTVILDPAPAAALDDALLRRVDILTPNETEAEQLTGIAVRDVACASRAAAELRARGVRGVLITLGENGALWSAAAGEKHFPPCKIEAVDTTAAGDAFNGGLAAALAGGRPIDQAIRMACQVGALAATRLGAQPSLPTAKDLAAFESREV